MALLISSGDLVRFETVGEVVEVVVDGSQLSIRVHSGQDYHLIGIEDLISIRGRFLDPARASADEGKCPVCLDLFCFEHIDRTHSVENKRTTKHPQETV